MKICIVSEIFAPQQEGGAEISTRHAAENLSAHHDVVVLALGRDGDLDVPIGECRVSGSYRLFRIAFFNSYLPSATRPTVSLLTKAIWYLRNFFGAVRTGDLVEFFRREQFDVVYAQNSSRMQPALYKAAAELNIPVVQHLRDYALMCPRAGMYRNGKNCERPCATCSLLTMRTRAATRHVGTAIAVSDFVRQRFLKHGLFTNADFHYLHNTNTARAHFDQGLLSGRPAPLSEFTFGFLGALSPEKGIEVLIDAFCALPNDVPARLLVGGRGHPDFVAYLHEKTKDLPAGRVVWMGHAKSDLVYRHADVMVVPSLWHEPQGRIIVEAAVYGIPVFAAESGGIPEVVSEYGLGWIYPARDSEKLKELMLVAAEQGPRNWRADVSKRFPGLANFNGTAEDSKYYRSLENLLMKSVKPDVGADFLRLDAGSD